MTGWDWAAAGLLLLVGLLGLGGCVQDGCWDGVYDPLDDPYYDGLYRPYFDPRYDPCLDPRTRPGR